MITAAARQEEAPVRKLRPSFANLVSICPAAFHADADRFAIHWEGGAAGRAGSALHMAAKSLVLREEIPRDEIIRRFGLNQAQQRDMDRMTACVRKYCFEQLHGGGWDATLVTEQTLQGRFSTARYVYDLGGTMDVGGFSADRTIWGNLDWKSTRIESQEVEVVVHEETFDVETGGENGDYHAQQMIYLLLAKQWIEKNLPREQWPEYYQYHVVYVRDWTEEVSEAYTAEQLDRWLARFLDRVETWDGREYHPGPQCQYCPRQADCPALYGLVTAMARALGDDQFTETAEQASDDELVSFKIKAGTVDALMKNALTLLKAIVVGRGGEIATPHGVLATLHVPRYKIDPIKAWPFCEAELSKDELAAATTLSKGAILDAVADHAPKGQKGKAKDAFWEQLQEADAVDQTESLQLRYKKAKIVKV